MTIPVGRHGLHMAEKLGGEANPVEVALHHAEPLHAPPKLLRLGLLGCFSVIVTIHTMPTQFKSQSEPKNHSEL